VSAAAVTTAAAAVAAAAPAAAAAAAASAAFASPAYRLPFLVHSVVIGNFQCFDQEQNLILTESEEIPPEQGVRRRTLGLVMIPGRHMAKCEVEG